MAATTTTSLGGGAGGDDRVLATAQQILKSLKAPKEDREDMLLIFSTFDNRLSGITDLINGDDSKSSEDEELDRFEAAEKIIIDDSSLYTESSRQSTSLFDPPNDPVEYFLAVDEIIQWIEHFSISPDHSTGKTDRIILDRAETAIQLAMSRLEDEFRHVLICNTIPPNAVSRCSTNRRSSLSFSSQDGGIDDNSGSFGEDAGSNRFHERGVSLGDDLFVDLVRPESILNLKDIIDRMVRSGYERECLQVYSSVRRDALIECLTILGVEKMSIEEVQKVEWKSLDEKMKHWVQAVKAVVGVLLSGEKRLCDSLFGEFYDLKDTCFNETAKACVMMLLNFGEAVAICKRSPEKLFRILDMYEALRDALPDLEEMVLDALVITEAKGVLKGLGEAVKGTFAEFENCIRHETSRKPVITGDVHPLPRYVMNYLKLLVDYSDAMDSLLEISEEALYHFKNDLGGEVSQLEDLSPLGRQILLLMSELEHNLEEKSKLYEDIALQQVFLMNNLYYLVRKVKDSDLKDVLREKWIRKRSVKVRQYSTGYLRVSWSKALSCLKDEGIGGSSNSASKMALKERFKNFNACFEEIYRVQTGWKVPDEQLREEMRISISERVIPAYRSFVGRFSCQLEGRHSSKYIKYSPEDLETFLLDLFEGSPAVLHHINGDCIDGDGNCSPENFDSPGSGASVVSGDQSDQSPGVSRFFNSESVSADDNSVDVRVSSIPLTETEISDREESSNGPVSSQGSGNGGSGVYEAVNSPSHDSGSYERDISSSHEHATLEEGVKVEGIVKGRDLKRKKENSHESAENRTPKCSRRSSSMENKTPQQQQSQSGFDGIEDDDEKRKARLIRNRESAQLSRQRKKHYVEELEEKVRSMHSTISDLSSKITYVMAENATLRQQLCGGVMCPPPPPGSGMYPHPPMPHMPYPWMPCAPYVVKPQGSQVPLVPIPRLKPQQPAVYSKTKKTETKKIEVKTKKVASISLLGLFFCIMLFGGLVPLVDFKFGGLVDNLSGRSSYVSDRWLYGQGVGRVWPVNDHMKEYGRDGEVGLSKRNNYERGRKLGEEMNELKNSSCFGHRDNTSEPLLASLYVPRNDKLVKIDGNLIIHSIMASEKAMASQDAQGKKEKSETGLAIPRDSALAIPEVGRNRGQHPNVYRVSSEQRRTIGSGSAKTLKDHMKSSATDGKMQQWFREGIAGPMLSSGMCTEVFQFDVSPAPGAIVPATTVTNISNESRHNATTINMSRNRRILHGLPDPLPGSKLNITEEHARNLPKDHLPGNKSSMVVSVLVDPKEGGDGDVDGMMAPKSLSRIFVVVLLDSVKYVTYSCGLPRASPLVAAYV